MTARLRWMLPPLLLGLVLAAGCSRRGEAGPWLARALAAHQRADAQLDRGRLDAARQSLQAMVEQPPPAGLAAADARVVRQDAFYRLAQIELLADRPRAALDWCRQGLALGDAGDLFAANLHLDRGRALERLGRDRDAAAAYHRALLINEKLLAAALGDRAPQPKDQTP